MNTLLWELSKFKKIVKITFRKSINLLKRILKANKLTHMLGKKIKAAGETEYEKISAKEFIEYLCPEETRKEQEKRIFPRKIKFSILVPLYNTPEHFLEEMIESVICQTYADWELCMADGSDINHSKVEEICKKYAEVDKRILYQKLESNQGISENTNACLRMATGDYIVLFDHDDFLHPSALYENMVAICEIGADFIYSDENVFKKESFLNIIVSHRKPDFAPDNLRGNNYICHLSVFSKELSDKVGFFQSACDGSQDHDMVLRLTEKAENIYHIPKVLYYWRSHEGSVAGNALEKTYAVDGAKVAIKQHLERLGLKAEIEKTKLLPTFYRLNYAIEGHPKVSIILHGEADKHQLKKCIKSIVKKSTYDNYEIINEESVKSSIDKATGEYIVLFNARNTVLTKKWIEELLMYAQRKDVAAVGAKILRPDNIIYSAGIVFNENQEAVYEYHDDIRDYIGDMGVMSYAHNICAVSSICMMFKASLCKKKDIFELNTRHETDLEKAAISFSLDLEKAKLVNVINPYCEIYYNMDFKRRSHEDKKVFG